MPRTESQPAIPRIPPRAGRSFSTEAVSASPRSRRPGILPGRRSLLHTASWHASGLRTGGLEVALPCLAAAGIKTLLCERGLSAGQPPQAVGSPRGSAHPGSHVSAGGCPGGSPRQRRLGSGAAFPMAGSTLSPAKGQARALTARSPWRGDWGARRAPESQ